MLEPDDRALLAEIHQGDRVTHVRIEITTRRRSPSWRVEPPPYRDLAPRASCLALLDKLEGDPALDAQYSTVEETRWDPQLLVDAKSVLASESETLSNEEIDSLIALSNSLNAIDYPPSSGEEEEQEELSPEQVAGKEIRDSASEALAALGNVEREPTPRVEFHLKHREQSSGHYPDRPFFHKDRSFFAEDIRALTAKWLRDERHEMHGQTLGYELLIPDMRAYFDGFSLKGDEL